MRHVGRPTQHSPPQGEDVIPQPGIRIDGKDLVVVPPKYPSTEVKEILGGRWNKADQAWHLAPTALNVLCLGEWYGGEFISAAPGPVQDLFKLEWGFPGFEVMGGLERRAKEHPQWETLYPFQQRAVEYIVCNPHRGTLLSLSPGLGKTPVTIVAMDVMECTKILVLAPLTLAKNWGREIERWSQYAREWRRATAAEKDPVTDVTITNFETVFYTVLRDENGVVYIPEDELWLGPPEEVNKQKIRVSVDPNDPEGEYVGLARNPRAAKVWIEAGPKKENPKTGKMVWVRERITQARPSYANIDWDLIVVDESILLKNRKAVKVEVIQQLAKFAHYVLLLSGSPTAKFRDDLYPQVRTVMPRGFTSYWRFAEFFCIVERGQWGWSIEGDRPDNDPHHYLKDFLLVMNQKDVLPELPDYIYDPIEIDLNEDQNKAFQQMLDEWIVALDAEEGAEVLEGDEDLTAKGRLAQQIRMLQITSNLCNLEKGAGKPMPHSSAKEDLLVDLIRQGDIEFPLLVWSWFVPTTLSLDARLDKEFGKQGLRTTYVNGNMSAEDKDVGIEMYKEGDVDILILQMSVGKFGHTLTDTRTVFYHDRTFDSDAYLQSLRRVKRIGLTHRPRLIVPRANFSADPVVEANLAGKLQSVSKVAAHDLKELLRSLGNAEWSMDNYDTGLAEDV